MYSHVGDNLDLLKKMIKLKPMTKCSQFLSAVRCSIITRNVDVLRYLLVILPDKYYFDLMKLKYPGNLSKWINKCGRKGITFERKIKELLEEDD